MSLSDKFDFNVFFYCRLIAGISLIILSFFWRDNFHILILLGVGFVIYAFIRSFFRKKLDDYAKNKDLEENTK